VVNRGSEASADFADGHRFPASGESLTEPRRHGEKSGDPDFET
jgi:hypothetical protein